MRQNKLGYFIKEGFESIFTHGFMSFASICIVVACLIIMGSFTLVALNINNIIGELENENQIVAFVNENYSATEAQNLESTLEEIPNVTDAVFVSRDEAWNSFVDQYEDASMLEDIDSEVLRDRYVIYMNDISQMEQTRENLKNTDGIIKVNAHLEIAKSFLTLKNVVLVISILLIAILFVVSLFIISNTIKLTTFERREQIAIMKMVGATSSFIRGPFLIEGLTLGIFGSLVAYLIQWALYDQVIARIIANSGINFISVMPFYTFAIPLVIAFIAVGLIVGLIGSAIAIRNYLRV